MRFLLALLALLAGIGSIDATAAPRDWNSVVTRTASGSYVIGNPRAKVRLVEYLSYTCPHCAEFLAESAPVLRGQMVRSGSTSIELRTATRDPLDLAAALLARCAGPAGLVGATDAMFAQQDVWESRGMRFQSVNGSRLNMYPQPARLRALADGAGLTDLMRGRGMTDATIDACFANDAELLAIAATSDRSWAAIHAMPALPGQPNGTPSFEVNGKPYAHIGWAGLEKVLRAAGAQ